MLRRLHLSIVSVSTKRSDPNAQDLQRTFNVNSCKEIRVYARRDDHNPVALTLDVGIRGHQAASAETLRASSPEKLEPRFSRKCSWAALKQLHKQLLLAVSGHDVKNYQCEQCRQIAAYLELCFKHAALFDRTWNGVMVLSAKKVTQLINTLLRLAHSMSDEEGDEGTSDPTEAHKQIVTVMTSFLIPTRQ